MRRWERKSERRREKRKKYSGALFGTILIAHSAECFPPTSPTQLRWWATHSNTYICSCSDCARFHKFKPCVEEGGMEEKLFLAVRKDVDSTTFGIPLLTYCQVLLRDSSAVLL